jgi:hypothetical protein
MASAAKVARLMYGGPMTNVEVEAKAREPIFDEETSQFVVQQAFDLWMMPEVNRRIAAGQLVPPVMGAFSASYIFPPGGGETVRLNDEVRGIRDAEGPQGEDK